MAITLPKPLGKGTIEKSLLKKDNFFKKPYGHCALGDLALYLGNEIVESNRYLPFENIDTVYKRIELPADVDKRMAFLGGGEYFLVVDYDGTESKQYKFKREAALDKLLNTIQERALCHVGAPYEKAMDFGRRDEESGVQTLLASDMVHELTPEQEKDLDLVAVISDQIQYTVDERGLVNIQYEYETFVDKFNKVFTKDKGPSLKTMQLERVGSFIFTHIDGKKTFREIAGEVSEEFGDTVEPLYERFLDYVRAFWEKHYIELLDNEAEEAEE